MPIQRLEPFHYLLEMENHAKMINSLNSDDVLEESVVNILLFKLGEYQLTFPLDCNVEITSSEPLLKCPWVKKSVYGLCDYHGQLYPIIDLNLLMGIKTQRSRKKTDYCCFLYDRNEKYTMPYGFMVEEIIGHQSIPLRQIETKNLINYPLSVRQWCQQILIINQMQVLHLCRKKMEAIKL